MNRDLALTGKFKVTDLETILETPVCCIGRLSARSIIEEEIVHRTAERDRTLREAHARERRPAYLGIS